MLGGKGQDWLMERKVKPGDGSQGVDPLNGEPGVNLPKTLPLGDRCTDVL